MKVEEKFQKRVEALKESPPSIKSFVQEPGFALSGITAGECFNVTGVKVTKQARYDKLAMKYSSAIQTASLERGKVRKERVKVQEERAEILKSLETKPTPNLWEQYKAAEETTVAMEQQIAKLEQQITDTQANQAADPVLTILKKSIENGNGDKEITIPKHTDLTSYLLNASFLLLNSTQETEHRAIAQSLIGVFRSKGLTDKAKDIVGYAKKLK